MQTWEDVQGRKATLQRESVAELSKEQQDILVKVLELEWEFRHLKTPDVRKPLRNFIQQVYK